MKNLIKNFRPEMRIPNKNRSYSNKNLGLPQINQFHPQFQFERNNYSSQDPKDLKESSVYIIFKTFGLQKFTRAFLDFGCDDLQKLSKLSTISRKKILDSINETQNHKLKLLTVIDLIKEMYSKNKLTTINSKQINKAVSKNPKLGLPPRPKANTRDGKTNLAKKQVNNNMYLKKQNKEPKRSSSSSGNSKPIYGDSAKKTLPSSSKKKRPIKKSSSFSASKKPSENNQQDLIFNTNIPNKNSRESNNQNKEYRYNNYDKKVSNIKDLQNEILLFQDQSKDIKGNNNNSPQVKRNQQIESQKILENNLENNASKNNKNNNNNQENGKTQESKENDKTTKEMSSALPINFQSQVSPVNKLSSYSNLSDERILSNHQSPKKGQFQGNINLKLDPQPIQNNEAENFENKIEKIVNQPRGNLNSESPCNYEKESALNTKLYLPNASDSSSNSENRFGYTCDLSKVIGGLKKLNLKMLSKCFSFVILKHINFSQEKIHISELKEVNFRHHENELLDLSFVYNNDTFNPKFNSKKNSLNQSDEKDKQYMLRNNSSSFASSQIEELKFKNNEANEGEFNFENKNMEEYITKFNEMKYINLVKFEPSSFSRLEKPKENYQLESKNVDQNIMTNESRNLNEDKSNNNNNYKNSKLNTNQSNLNSPHKCEKNINSKNTNSRKNIKNKEKDKNDDLYESQYIEYFDPGNKKEYLVSKFVIFNSNYNFALNCFENGAKSYPPQIENIHNYSKLILKKCKMEDEIPIIALIYIEKLMKNTGLLINSMNWKRTLFISLLIASKIWDDDSFENEHFHKVFPDKSIKEINELERVYLELINYELYVSGKEYAKYYFILRSYADKACANFTLKLITYEEIRRLNSNAQKMQNIIYQSIS